MLQRLILCHDCCSALSREERAHYLYQCHACVMIEHERLRLAAREPDHPEAATLAMSAVDLAWSSGEGPTMSGRARPARAVAPSSVDNPTA